ncbi:hypothetical protein PRK78_007341 [Emydomyces testavorans]|uniref:Uncharacterized protein n=1 Tax=Emydomyces testavorans TaxID=2070801 RepID=A0AAF0IQH7_9EURO|nr:hypothetical protein PRK78_007341 [Emydomyces testavorans]
MSLDHDTSHPNSDKTPLKPVLNKKRSHLEYLADIDSRFKRLTDDVFPYHPYLLTVPTDNPFRLGSRTVTNWAVGKGCLFATEEEQLQYMTFLSRQGEDTLLVAVGGWSDESGNIMREEESSNPAAELSSKMPQNGQKKKISFNDYKKKALESPAPPTPATLPNGRLELSPPKEEVPQAPKGEISEGPAVATKPGDSRKPNGLPQSNIPPKKDQKPSPPKSIDRPSPSPAKKPRLENGSGKESRQVPTKAKNQSTVPELLSPTLPPATRSPHIPPLLSPTLPPKLEEELLNLTDEPIAAKSTPYTAKKTVPKSTNIQSDVTKSKLTESNRPRSDSVSSTNTKSDTKSKASKNTSLPTRNGAKGSPIPAQLPQRSIKKVPVAHVAKPKMAPSSVLNKSAPVTPAKVKLIVRLKYGRQNRKRVEALLRMTTKRKAASEKAPTKQKVQEDTPDKKEAKVLLPSKSIEKQQGPVPGNKRPKPADDIGIERPALKRPKITPTVSSERPETPSALSTSKPAVPQTKAQYMTPKKEAKADTKGANMRRTLSTESESKTPATKMNNTQDERPTSKPSPALSTDNQSTKSLDLEWRAWRNEWQKYKDLGRELKHACDRLTKQKKSAGSQQEPSDAKLSAVTAMEVILCFMLAFIADDKSKSLTRQAPDSTTWRTLIPYWQAAASRTAPYPYLHGVCLLLGAISQEAIHILDLDRLATITLPGDPASNHNSASHKDRTVVSTPGSGDPDNASLPFSALAQDSKLLRDLSELRTRLPESHRESNRLWLEGNRLLPESVFPHEYPATWLRRSRNFTERGREVLKVGKYSGDFFLPLARIGGSGTGTAGAIEGVRFAFAFLQEWCEKEGVEWVGRLDI